MAAYDVTTAAASLEFGTQEATGNHIIKIDTNHVVNVWNNFGTLVAQSFTVNTTTWAVTTAAARFSLEGASGYGNTNQVVDIARIDTNHIIVFWRDSATLLAGEVLAVNTSTWAVSTSGAKATFSATSASNYSTVQMDANHFLHFWDENEASGFARVFAVNTTTWAVTAPTTALEYDTVDGRYAAALAIDSSHVINFWAGSGADGFVQVLEVNTSTWAVTTLGTALEFDTGNGTYKAVAQIDANHFLAVWHYNASNNSLRAQVFTVNTTTWAVTTAGAVTFLPHTTITWPALVKIDTNHFLVTFNQNSATASAAGSAEARVLAVNTSTWAVTTTTANALVFDASTSAFSGFHAAAQMDASHFIDFWSGQGADDGFVQILSVALPVAANDERDATLYGAGVGISESDAKIHGIDTIANERSAHTVGVVGEVSSVDAKLSGIATTQSTVSAKVTGGIDVNSERDVTLHGIDIMEDDLSARIVGSLSTNSTRAAVTHGSITTNSERDAVVRGSLSDDDERDATLHGIDTMTDERDAKIHGLDTADSARSAKTSGIRSPRPQTWVKDPLAETPTGWDRDDS